MQTSAHISPCLPAKHNTSFSCFFLKTIGLLQLTVTWYKIRHAGEQAHYYSRTGTLKQRDLNQWSLTCLCFDVPVREYWACPPAWFCTTWSLASKGLLLIAVVTHSTTTIHNPFFRLRNLRWSFCLRCFHEIHCNSVRNVRPPHAPVIAICPVSFTIGCSHAPPPPPKKKS